MENMSNINQEFVDINSLVDINFPDIDEIVNYRVDETTDVGQYVTLLDYCDINPTLKALIVFPEVNSHAQFTKLLKKHKKDGEKGKARVLRIDKEKGYVDLTIKLIRFGDEDIDKLF